MRRAFNALKNGRPGPVMVEVPADVMTAEVRRQRGRLHDRSAPTRSAGDARDIDDAAKMLIEATCPIIIAGQGVLYAEASAELVALAELLDSPGHDDDRRQERLPGGPCAGAGLGRRRLYRARPAFPARSDVIFAIGTSA